MKKSKFTESQIFNILKEAEKGIRVQDLCRTHGFGNFQYSCRVRRRKFSLLAE